MERVMRVSEPDVDTLKTELRRDTYWQALYISSPVSGLALYYLLIAAGYYFRPLVLLGVVSPDKWQPMEVSPAVETGFTVGLPLTVIAIGVYALAVRVLSRVKAGEPVFPRSRDWRRSRSL
jgi:hypothetical protein